MRRHTAETAHSLVHLSARPGSRALWLFARVSPRPMDRSSSMFTQARDAPVTPRRWGTPMRRGFRRLARVKTPV